MNIPRRLIRLILFIAVILQIAICSGIAVHVPQVQAAKQINWRDSDLHVVRIHAATANEQKQLAERGVDLLEIRSGDMVYAVVNDSERRALVAEGWQVDLDALQMPQYQGNAQQTSTFREGYHTITETETFLHDIAQKHSNLVTLVHYGDSWEKIQSGGAKGHNLWAVRLSNKALVRSKPVFLLVAAIHAREIVTTELALRYIHYLLQQYGQDADVTRMLNEQEVVVIPIANPDGRVLVEEGYLQRKNTNEQDASCATLPNTNSQPGVDLNRNFPFAWGTINNIYTPPCSETFPGRSAASEPETMALQRFVRQLFPTQKGPVGAAPVSSSTSGIMISLHSFSNLVLWPWGYTNKSAPNGAALERLGNRLAAFNGYTAQQSFDLYATSGTMEDWVYGELGVPAFTFEVGPPTDSPCASFFPPIECLDEGEDGSFWQRNLPAFLYATQVARAPYTLPAGPDVSDIRVISDTQNISITATIDGRANGRIVRSAALSVQEFPWSIGSTISLLPSDGGFDSSVEQVYAIVPRESVTPRTLMLLRGKTADWGTTSTTWALPGVKRDYAVTQPVIWLPNVRKR